MESAKAAFVMFEPRFQPARRGARGPLQSVDAPVQGATLIYAGGIR